ncbi:MAG: DUF4249 domain-containing protein [Bacteroidia bacterium]|nr:DUF4249 domain-containing protein [Bacteroidia bacterium]MCX7652300.1 DUF4249 domain-containing protein [Bacteroidia bacterium]MDW8416562.1 DUF4249 family protein [Bacteroidia bacterium]
MLRQLYTKVIIFAVLGGCKTDVELIAPEAREKLVVYGILRAESDTQYVRIGRLFVTREDAAAYAARTDLSVHAQVQLTDGQRTWLAMPETVIKTPQNPFFPIHVVYKIVMRPAPRTRYTLTVTVPDNPTLNVTATTVMPSIPYIARPETTMIVGSLTSHPVIDLMKRYTIQFFPQSNTQLPALGAGYELRFSFTYGEVRGGDTIWRTLNIGPRRIAGAGSGAQSYILQEKELLTTVYANLSPFNYPYVYDNSRFSRAWRLQITALDTALYNYLRVNDPANTDFTTIKPEYSNVQNGLGVFGSAATAERFFRIDSCSEYLLRLNDAPKPSTPCSLE